MQKGSVLYVYTSMQGDSNVKIQETGLSLHTHKAGKGPVYLDLKEKHANGPLPAQTTAHTALKQAPHVASTLC